MVFGEYSVFENFNPWGSEPTEPFGFGFMRALGLKPWLQFNRVRCSKPPDIFASH